MGKRLTTKEFIEKAKEIHGDKYDYSLVEYKNWITKVKIICSIHGEFKQTPEKHIYRKQGCSLCGIESRTNKRRKDIDSFIEEAGKVHEDKYDYSLVEYINNKTKVKIICPIHGEFFQIPKHHLNGHGCFRCGIEGPKYNNEIFIQKAREVHGDKYDYSLVEYVDYSSRLKIICPIHGEFTQQAYVHLYGCGCPTCNESHGEKEIRILLQNKGVYFEQEKSFDDLKYKRLLRYDFYLPSYNLLIEYDGQQHFDEDILFWNEDIKIRDELKTEYANRNEYFLIRIGYWEEVEEVLGEFF